jgi:hypothetical protein
MRQFRLAIYNYLVIAILFLLLFFYSASHAQTLTPNGTDPTEIRNRFDIIIAQLTALANSHIMGASIAGEYAINSWLAAGLDMPYVYARFSGGTSTGIGDIRTRILVSLYRAPQFELVKAVATGIDVHMDTGAADRGMGIGRSIVILPIMVSMQLEEGFLIIPRGRYLFSISEHQDEIDEIRFEIDNVLFFPEEFWISVMPEMIFDLKGIRQSTMNLQSTLGKMISEHWGVAAVFRTNLFGDPRVESRSQLSFRYLF